MTSCPILVAPRIPRGEPSASWVGSFDLDVVLRGDRVAVMVSPVPRRWRDEDGDLSSKNSWAQEPLDYPG